MTATTNALTEKPIKVPACSCQNARATDPELAPSTGRTPGTTQNACSALSRRVISTARPIASPEPIAFPIHVKRPVGATASCSLSCELAQSGAALLFWSGNQITNNAGCAMKPAITQPAKYGNTEPTGAGVDTANMNDRSKALRMTAMRPLAIGGTSDAKPAATVPVTASQTLPETRVPRPTMNAPKTVSIAD